MLDQHTINDLELFESATGGKTLFEFCDFTRNDGGAKVLRRRMAAPFCDAARIRATQAAISFISSHRDAFRRLPPAFTTSRVEHYAKEILPVVPHSNPLEFAAGVFGVWVNHERHYSSIARGVYVTCGLISALRTFIEQDDLAVGDGEIAPLLAELRQLIFDTGLSSVTGPDIGAWPIRVMRHDQLFRHLEKASMARVMELIYEIDALVSMADATERHELNVPHIADGPLRLSATALRHPFVQNAVANPVELDPQKRVLFLTGPNMAGKTTYLRSVATALYLAHLGMGVPAARFEFVPAERLFSMISLQDDLHAGISYFRAEALRARAVAEAIAGGYRVIALMDEPFKGTNVKDAFDASLAILERLAARQDCLIMFSSHLIELKDELDNTDNIDCRYFEAETKEGRLRFNYRLRTGISSQRLGMRVLREEGVFDLLDGQS